MIRILIAFLALVSVGCAPTRQTHRDLGPDQAVCQNVIALGALNLEPARQKKNTAARCFVQRHKVPDLPAAALEKDEQTWSQIAASQNQTLAQTDEFTLAFVELNDALEQRVPAQLEALEAHLENTKQAGRQNYVIAFVHGWRHDASLRDNDVRKFRILLGYARSALNTRCVEQGQYCNADLTGLFVGWRGRSFPEPLLTNNAAVSPFAVLAATTFWNRKAKSEELSDGQGAPVEQILERVQDRLRLDPGRTTADKYLIVGHSLGGNIMANIMNRRTMQALEDRKQNGGARAGRALAPPLGDLVVLFNPASEAAKWTQLQRKLRDDAGLPRDFNALTATDGQGQTDPKQAENLRNWRRAFPLTQRPVYIAVTSTNNWSGIERKNRRIEYDTSTGFLFPLAQRLAGKTDPEQRQAIGHLSPEYETQFQLNSAAAGSTHELSVNTGTGTKASFQQSGRPNESWCDPATGWLTTVRLQQAEQQERQQRESGYAQKRFDNDGWDYGLTREEGDFSAAANIAKERNEASIQWRHSHYLRDQPDRWSVVSGRSPFWNVRALDTAIRDHAGWVNYPMWCSLNQLVLDDVTNDGRVAEAVQETQASERAAEKTINLKARKAQSQ